MPVKSSEPVVSKLPADDAAVFGNREAQIPGTTTNKS